MIKLSLPILIIIMLLAGTFQLRAQAEADSVIKAFNTSNAELLANYFNETVDLGLPEKDQDYGKEQGAIVMAEFFKKYPLKSFIVDESGNTDPNTHFIIGSYETANKTYQVLILLKARKEQLHIHKIKFE